MKIVVQVIRQGGSAGAAALDRAAELSQERAGRVLFAFGAELAIDLVVKVRHAVDALGMHGLAIGEDRFARFGEGEARAFDEPAIEVAGAGEDVAEGEEVETEEVGNVAGGFD